ncbi:MAG: response regulator [Gemmatimonadota bacterium]
MNRRLLVVDDEPQSVRTLCDILGLHGWECLGALSGEDALDTLSRQDFDAVLMDIRMPGMNGVETLVAMRERAPDLHIILMTAYSASSLVEEAERRGSLAVLPKPVQFERLLGILQDTVAERGPVLIVDDDPAFLTTLSSVLAEHGYGTLTAGSVGEAMDRIREASPRVVLLDLILESGQARDSILAIREVSPEVAIILYSGHPVQLDATLEALPRQLVNAALYKPFRPEALLAMLEEVSNA